MTDDFDYENVNPETLREWKAEMLQEFKREMRSYLKRFPDDTSEEKRDLRRWGNYVTTTNGLIEADVFGVARGANPRSIAQSNGGYWPIHTDELGANPNLVQTPGW